MGLMQGKVKPELQGWKDSEVELVIGSDVRLRESKCRVLSTFA